MAVDPELLELYVDSITIEPSPTISKSAQNAYGAAVTHAAKIEGKRRLVKDANGRERLSTVTVYLTDVVTVDVNDRITLPAVWVPRSPQIMAIERLGDETGGHHSVIYCE